MFLLLPLWGECSDGERQAKDWVQDQQPRRPGGMEESSESKPAALTQLLCLCGWLLKAGGGRKSLEPISSLLFLNF